MSVKKIERQKFLDQKIFFGDRGNGNSMSGGPCKAACQKKKKSDLVLNKMTDKWRDDICQKEIKNIILDDKYYFLKFAFLHMEILQNVIIVFCNWNLFSCLMSSKEPHFDLYYTV